jgi:beta-glucosidase
LLQDIESSDAILETWFLGSQANEAIVDLLLGIENPSGKLSMSFPRQVGQIPIYYDYLQTGRPKEEGIYNEFVSYYIDEKNSPLFPFGYGLSYAKFVYKDLKLNRRTITSKENIKAVITIENDSSFSGKEVVQLYIRDHKARISRPIMELKQFQKIHFKAHESKEIVFEITIKDLTYINSLGEEIFEPGKFSVMIGKNALDYITQDFILE